jgi:hypothetical protein
MKTCFFSFLLLFQMAGFTQPVIVELDSNDVRKMEFSGVFKSSISVELAGASGYVGLVYDLFLKEKLRVGASIGYPGAGVNVKWYPFGIGRGKYVLNAGLRGQLFLPPNETSTLLYNLPIGISYFALNRLNFDLDFGPAYAMPAVQGESLSNFTDDLYFWGAFKIGYRFSFFNMKRVRELNKL